MGQPGQDILDRKTRTGLSGHVSRTGLPGLDREGRSAITRTEYVTGKGKPWQDSQDRKAWTKRQPGQDNLYIWILLTNKIVFKLANIYFEEQK